MTPELMYAGIAIDPSSFGRAGLFLGVPFVLLIFYFQWHWAKTCNEFIRVLVVQQAGGGKFELAPKAGGQVTIKNPHSNTTRTWPINELSTVDVLYPGVGFVPAWMQKTIRMAIVHEGDWEPLLNRSPHLTKVASPDMVMALEAIANEDSSSGERIKALLVGVCTAPTREMIGSPAVLGNLMQERISEIVATVSKDVFEPLKEILQKMAKPVNPTIVYILLGLTAILAVYLVFQINAMKEMGTIPDLAKMTQDISLIKQSLGVR